MKVQVEEWSTDQFRNHPRNIEVFGEIGTTELDAMFLESVAEKGVLQPVLAAKDGTIISGHRRRQAAARAGIKKIPVIVRKDLKNEDDVDAAWFDCNLDREKTMEQKARWFAARKEIYARITLEREKKGRKSGVSDPPATLPEGSEAAELAASEVGLSRNTANKAAKVVEAIDAAEEAGDHETASELRETLNKKGAASALAKANGKHEKPTKKQHRLQPILDRAKEFKSIVNAIGTIRGRIETLTEEDCGKLIHWSNIQRDTMNLQSAVKFAAPFGICPYCLGKKGGCSACKELGWVNQSIFEKAPKEKQDAVARLSE